MNLDIGWGDDLTTETNFPDRQGVGQTKEGADVVGINNIVEDKNYGMLGDRLMKGDGGFGLGSAKLMRIESDHRAIVAKFSRLQVASFSSVEG